MWTGETVEYTQCFASLNNPILVKRGTPLPHDSYRVGLIPHKEKVLAKTQGRKENTITGRSEELV